MPETPETEDLEKERSAKTQKHNELSAAIEKFSLYSGDPASRMFDRLAKMSKGAHRARHRALIVFFAGWGLICILTIFSGSAIGFDGAFLGDLNAFSRYALAAPLLMLMDRRIDAQLRLYLDHFADAPLIAPYAMKDAAIEITAAIDRASGILPFVLCAALAYVLVLVGQSFGGISLPDWRYIGPPEDIRLTVAAWWAALIAAPLFWFLVLRAFWRYLVWSRLLRQLAHLDLRLVVTHTDGAGGLGFLGRHPNIFSALIFALAIAFAGAVAQELNAGQLSPQAYGWLLTVWVAVTALLFAIPLSAFQAPLSELKRKTRFAAATRSTLVLRAQERDVFGRNLAAPNDDENPGVLMDATKLDDAAKKMRTIPFSRETIAPLIGAALLPLLAAGATQIPIKELFGAAKKLLLL
ncbi:MAG: hypothetical protein ABJH07_23485 [Sedimentitalea sp.]|uniref:hypothetical protein n=1 Tax=Sedimentitalea sp. TaxID=2048915 RepID=UPI0032651ADE